MEFTFITSNTGITIPKPSVPEDNQVRLPEYMYFEFVEPVTSLNLTVDGVNLNAVDGLGNPVQLTESEDSVSFPSTTLIGIDVTPLEFFSIDGDAKLKAVLSWGEAFNKESVSFYGCSGLISVPNYLPPSVTSMNGMFYGCTSFNQDLSSWDVSNVTDMNGMFYNCTNFNQDLSSWDVGSVTDIGNMFLGCTNFNQELSGWDVSNVTKMFAMFRNCTSFNQDISSWDISSVTNMISMFDGCTSFNQDLSSWNLIGKETSSFDSNTPSWTLPKPIFN